MNLSQHLADLAGRNGALATTVTWMQTLAFFAILVILPLGLSGALS